MQPRARAQGRQTKPGTKNNVPVQLPYKSTSTVSDSAQRDIPPLPFSGHASSPWRSASPSPHANRISAFPFLRNPIILWRWWTLPSQLEANPTLISQPKLKKTHWSESVWKAIERNRQERSRDRFQDIQQCKGNCSASFFLS